MVKWNYCALVNIDKAFETSAADTFAMGEALVERAKTAGIEVDISERTPEQDRMLSYLDNRQSAELWLFTSKGVKTADNKFQGPEQMAKILSQLGSAGWEMVGRVNNMLFFKKPQD